MQRRNGRLIGPDCYRDTKLVTKNKKIQQQNLD
jgi:hypothetical protein